MRTLSDLFRNVMQLGYVTEDIDAATAYLESTLGTVRCLKHYKSSLGGGSSSGSSFVVVDGTPADEWVIDVALVNAGATNLEIIRPVSGAVDLYRNAVRPGQPATLHHIGVRIDDFDEASALVEAAGKQWAQYGVSGDIRFGYLDLTAELGHFVEVMELGPQSSQMFAGLAAASDTAAE
ncbi:VOC family protein [Streptomyces sp. NPDC056656]|uniref:VOC family protein n=1 Tax=Streptomyces sp. NPDC056656 TaxID=3345895 RepID=UPI003677B169